MAVFLAVFLLAFVLTAALVLIYAGFMFWCASKFKSEDLSEAMKPSNEGVSVVIPFRNEAQHLGNCLEAFLKQKQVNFPYEILLINDGSEDDGVSSIVQYANRLPLVLLHSNGIGKKAALQTGIDAARFNVVYTIDADCVVKPNTLNYMGNAFEAENLNMLCGLVNLAPAIGIFQNLQAAESAALVGVSAVMLNAQMPATCNGANLMFRKDVFLKLKGYENYKHLSSGDDDFLMHAFFNFNPKACRYAIHPDAVLETQTEKSIRSFFAQRARWASKRKHYAFPYNTYLLVLMGLKFLTYWILFLGNIISYFYWGDYSPLFLFLLLYFSELTFASRLRGALKLNYFSILILPLYQFYLPLVLIYAKLFRIHWKGRVIDEK